MPIPSKTRLLAFSLLLPIALSCQSLAQEAAAVSKTAVEPSKIAFVNLQEAVVTCNEGKQEAAALTQKFASQQNALKVQDAELKKLKDDFQAVSDKLSDDERTSRLRTIQDKQKSFDRNYQDYQTATQEAQQEALNRIIKKMLPVLEKYAVANGYTAVIDVSNPQTSPVLWLSKGALITQQLIDTYNAQSGGASAPAAPAKR